MSKMVVFCTKGNVIFNSSGDLEVVEKKKSIKNRNIKNRIFEDMRSQTDDPFWDMFLIKSSRNSFPIGFSFRDNILFFSQKPKTNYELVLDPENIQSSFSIFKTFMMERGVLSPSDKEEIEKKIEERPLPKPVMVDNWKDLGKNQTDILYQYKLKLVKELSLSQEEQEHMSSIINMGISSGIFNESNIVVRNSEIEKIHVLKFDDISRKFTIDTKDVKIKKQKLRDTATVETSTTCNTISTKIVNNISKNWENFVETVLFKNI